jgi:hypothetical protein
MRRELEEEERGEGTGEERRGEERQVKSKSGVT